jgi:hypothetical protein
LVVQVEVALELPDHQWLLQEHQTPVVVGVGHIAQVLRVQVDPAS